MSLIQNCPEFASFADFVRENATNAMNKGVGELPAALTAIDVPVITKKQQNPYSLQGSKLQFAAQGPDHVVGFQGYVAFQATANEAQARVINSQRPADRQEGIVTLIVGCTYFFVEEEELRSVLELATGADVQELRPQLRRRTQRTGLWFLDVAKADVPAFLAMDRCMLMHNAGTFVYTSDSQKRLRMWTDARDAALKAVGLETPVKGLKPMTIEASKEFREEVDQIMAAFQ